MVNERYLITTMYYFFY